jgi:hypothetical protein
MDCIQPAQDRMQCQAITNTTMKNEVPREVASFFTGSLTTNFTKRTTSREVHSTLNILIVETTITNYTLRRKRGNMLLGYQPALFTIRLILTDVNENLVFTMKSLSGNMEDHVMGIYELTLLSVIGFNNSLPFVIFLSTFVRIPV